MPKTLIFAGTYVALAAFASAADIFTVSDPSTSLIASITTEGVFRIETSDPAWAFSGTLGAEAEQVTTLEAEDLAGRYAQLRFRFSASGGPREGSIRIYFGRPVVVFSERYLAEGPNAGHFPRFTELPATGYQFGLGSWEFSFNPGGIEPGSPWLFFDASRNAFVLSPASNFIIGQMRLVDGGGLEAALDPAIPTLKDGFSHETMLAVGKGINAVFDLWGRALTDLYGKRRPANDADVTLATVGLWTDNASPYYYDPGAAGQKLIDAKADYALRGISLGYIQADSWWYAKGIPPAWNNNGTGLWTLQADTTLFPHDLSGFRDALGVPLVVHARYWHQQSPDRQQYQFSGNVPIDPLYWKHLAGYLSRSGVSVFEQDWLSGQASTAINTDDPDAFFDNMAAAMAAKGIGLQYSMPKAHHFLQGAKYSNLTSIRVSADGFCRDRWDSFLFNSRLASALGIWPFSDNFRSADLRQLTLAVLSAGPLAPADEVAQLNAGHVQRALRSDGVIVKPDLPLAPTDATYIAIAQDPAQPMVASTLTDFGALKAYYVFAYARTDDGTRSAVSFSPEELGIAADVFPQSYVYNVFGAGGAVVESSDPFQHDVDRRGSYFLVTPIGPSGMALLGDVSKLVPLGKKRISALADDGAITATVEFGEGEESVELTLYAPSQPAVSSVEGVTRISAADGQLYKLTVSRCGAVRVIVKIQSGNSSPAPANPFCYSGSPDPPENLDWPFLHRWLQ